MPAEETDMQRRHSSATETSAPHGTDGGLKRHTSQENVELIPTRTTKVATSKPAANPLQFIKVGPCNLYRSAQEQLKKVEEVKKVKKEVRDEAEDWQSNLDNWKCSRRKKQEHIIERVVEVKKLELEEHDRNRRRSKTFSEMMEERNSRGRKLSLPIYQDEDNDLSDLGISSKTSTSSTIEEEAQNKDDVFEKDSESEDSTNQNNCVNQNGTNFNGHKEEDSPKNSSEGEEYTYDKAIQNYVNYAETRIKSRNIRSSSEETNFNGSNGRTSRKSSVAPFKPRRGSTPKIEEKLSELEQLKKRSMSTTDLSTGESNRKSIVVPKVDINKRRELFEKMPDQEELSGKLNHRLSGDFSSTKSIRERLSSFGKQIEESPSKKAINRLSAEISVKDRLSNIEKYHSNENLSSSSTGKINRISTENISNAPTVRDRLNSLERSAHKEVMKSSTHTTEKIITNEDINETTISETAIETYNTKSISNNVCNTDSEFKNTELTDVKTIEAEIVDDFKTNDIVDNHLERTSSPEEEIFESARQQHYRHRSLDSLDIDSNADLNNDCFGRVQSLEDLDFCRNYPASSLSGDTDREDSGIHTADVSSSVSQADDCDSHLDSSSVDTEFKFQHHPTIIEEISRKTGIDNSIHSNNEESPVSKIQNNKISVSSINDNNSEVTVIASIENSSSALSSSSATSTISTSLKLPLRPDLNDPLPVIPECPSEPVTPSDIKISMVAYTEDAENSDLNKFKNSDTYGVNDSKFNKNSLNDVTCVEECNVAVLIDNNEDSGNKDIDSINVDNSHDNVTTIVDSNYNFNVNTPTTNSTAISADSNELNSLNISGDVNIDKSSNDNIINILNINSSEHGELIKSDSSIKLVEDISSSFSDNNSSDTIAHDNQKLDSADGNGDDNLVVCMGELDDKSFDIEKEKRQTVIEICEKVDSADLPSPLTTPIISVDGINFNGEFTYKGQQF